MSRKDIMLAYPFTENRLKKWNSPCIVQPKLDGIRCRALPMQGGYILVSSEENIIHSCPHINEQLNKYFKGSDIEFDGELYAHHLPFEGIISRVNRTVNFVDATEIQFNIFDYVSDEPNLQRVAKLIDIIPKDEHLKRVHSVIAESLEDVMNIYDVFLNDGYEGIIVRHFEAPYIRRRSTYMMKFKPKKSDVYDIVGWSEECAKDGTPKRRLGSICCLKDGQTFWVGSGLIAEQRERLWQERGDLVGNKLLVGYQHTTQHGVPRFPVVLEVQKGETNEEPLLC